jgi:4-alpha-glucanotransferase
MSDPKPSKRSSGVLLHPTSLPGPYGIGDLGPAAYAWIDLLAPAKQKWWQILPLGPTGFGDSPYQSFSAFAGNPLLISPELLRDEGLVDAAELVSVHFPPERVDYKAAIVFKSRLLARAWESFQRGRAAQLRQPFEEFQRRQANWLSDYALFMALTEAHAGKSWQEWPRELRTREPAAMARARKDHAGAVSQHQFRQFLFFEQWGRLRSYAREKKIGIVGDIPIFVAAESADVWAHPHLFQLDKECRPTVVAGVPPDYFSATGQLWGNPLYNWDAMEKHGFAWWLARFRALFELVDVVRLDHFRGFEAYWEVPAGRPNAIVGRWVKAPGDKLFTALLRDQGKLPIIAEDLGVITPEVEALRLKYGLPGMRVLQFAFGDKPTNPYLPHNFDANTVVYTGTHDNDTSRGWYASIGERERDHLRRYLARDGSDVAWDLIRAAWASVADYAMVPAQDLLNLASEARMNTPGRQADNWSWRLQPGQVHPGVLDRLTDLTELYGRS